MRIFRPRTFLKRLLKALLGCVDLEACWTNVERPACYDGVDQEKYLVGIPAEGLHRLTISVSLTSSSVVTFYMSLVWGYLSGSPPKTVVHVVGSNGDSTGFSGSFGPKLGFDWSASRKWGIGLWG